MKQDLKEIYSFNIQQDLIKITLYYLNFYFQIHIQQCNLTVQPILKHVEYTPYLCHQKCLEKTILFLISRLAPQNCFMVLITVSFS